MYIFFFQAEDGIRDLTVTGVQTCALPILSRQIGNASTPAKVLKTTALPSMIGNAAWGPRLPRLRTFEPSVTTAMVLPRQVYSNEVTGSLWMARQGSATPGV